MSLIVIILALVVVGIVLWAINQYVPMSPTIKRILNIVVIVIVVIWLLKVLGLWAYLSTIHV